MSVIAQGGRFVFQEAINTFKELLSAREIAEATEIWEQFAGDYYGQVELLDAARSGDTTAINFLYLKLIPQITSVFWNNFLGRDAGHRQRRLLQGDQYEFASIVYQTLMSAHIQNMSTEDALATMKGNMASLNPNSQIDTFEDEYADMMGAQSPLNTFDPSHFDEETNVIEKFGYYLMGALKNESMKFNKHERRGGITGNREAGKEDVVNMSFEGATEGLDIDADHINYSGMVDEGDFHQSENMDAWEKFAKDPELDDERFKPSTRDVLIEFLNQEDKFDVMDAANKFGTTRMTLRSRLKGMADILEYHNIDQDTFLRLLKDNGGPKLASYL